MFPALDAGNALRGLPGGEIQARGRGTGFGLIALRRFIVCGGGDAGGGQIEGVLFGRSRVENP